ncbi:MAG TPA: M56 family metallopeptidase [Blastocatellia bacterium]|jgi:HEAT repeat protein|nr:M56 family metallopeptidase [Blastocatellia bacterium]
MLQFFDPASVDTQSTLLVRLLVDVSIKGALILLLASGLTFACRRSSAAARHLVWSLALISLLALPGLSVLLPAWQVAALSPVLPEALLEARPEVLPEATPGAAQAAQAPALPAEETYPPVFVSPESRGLGRPGEAATARGLEDMKMSGSKIVSSQAAADEGAHAAGSNNFDAGSFRLPVWLLAIWLSGVIAILARLLVGTASVRKIAREAERVTEPSRVSMVRSLSWQIGLDREVDLLVSDRISMPLTFGSLRSVVLLPAEAALWDEERLQIVLLHELAHVRRKDCLTQLTAHLSCALHWFNPLIWIALRELRIERERACDDYVLFTGTKASDYASHLLDIARSLGVAECSSFATVAIARRSQLEGRLLAILDPSLSRKGLKRMPKFLIALALISLIVPLAAIQPRAQARALTGQSQSGRAAEATPPATPFVAPRLAAAASVTPKEPQEYISVEQPPAPLPEPLPQPMPSAAGQADGQSSKPAEPKDLSGVADALAEALKDQDAEVRLNALRALANMGDPRAIDALIQGMKDSDPDMRESAIQGLALSSDARAVDPLIEALRDQDPQVREKAAWALAMKSEDRTVDPLINALRDENREVREKAAWALGMKSDDRVVDPLIAALADRQADVRQKAAWALGLQGDGRAVEPLISALKDENPEVREIAAWALGLKGDKRAEGPLNAAMKDPNNGVRQKARWALGLMLLRAGERGGTPAPDEDGVEVDPKFDMQLKIDSKIKIKTNRAIKNRN